MVTKKFHLFPANLVDKIRHGLRVKNKALLQNFSLKNFPPSGKTCECRGTPQKLRSHIRLAPTPGSDEGKTGFTFTERNELFALSLLKAKYLQKS